MYDFSTGIVVPSNRVMKFGHMKWLPSLRNEQPCRFFSHSFLSQNYGRTTSRMQVRILTIVDVKEPVPVQFWCGPTLWNLWRPSSRPLAESWCNQSQRLPLDLISYNVPWSGARRAPRDPWTGYDTRPGYLTSLWTRPENMDSLPIFTIVYHYLPTKHGRFEFAQYNVM